MVGPLDLWDVPSKLDKKSILRRIMVEMWRERYLSEYNQCSARETGWNTDYLKPWHGRSLKEPSMAGRFSLRHLGGG